MRENIDRIQNHELDTITAIAFAQEISRELALDRLLVRLLEILRQTTPAQRIYLLEQDRDRWLPIAANDIGANEINIFSSSVLGIPMAIVNYVAQTQTSLILDDAANEERFVKDPDVNARQVRSVLCVPLLEENFSGVLYLENREIAEAFTPQLSNCLQIITTQAATAISNARQHQQLKTELQASQAELAGILDIAKDAIISVDGSQNICRFNQGAEKIFGYKAEEVLGQSLDLLLPKRAVETHHQHIKDFGNKSVAPSRMMGERRSVYGRRQDGSEFPAEASISKFKLGQQKIYTAILYQVRIIN